MVEHGRETVDGVGEGLFVDVSTEADVESKVEGKLRGRRYGKSASDFA